MTTLPIPGWFVQRRGSGWRVTGRGWIALAVFALLVAAALYFLTGINRIVLTSMLIMGFIALSVGKIDMRRLGLD